MLRSQLGIDSNAPIVQDQVEQALNEFRMNWDTAAVRVDVVAHSLGGLITRDLESFERYWGPSSFGKALCIS